MTRIGIIAAHLDDWHAERFIAAAARMGDADVLGPLDFGVRIEAEGRAVVTVRGEPAGAFDLFLTPRPLGDAGDGELQLALYACLEETGALLMNPPGALLEALDKLRSSWRLARAGLPSPEVAVAQTAAEARAALAWLGQAVAKPRYGSLGIGVERVGLGDEARLDAIVAAHGAVYLQRFVPRSRHDVRAFVVGDGVEAAIAREAPPGDFRANVSLGAAFRALALPTEAARLAVAAARALGLDYAGVDLLLTDDGPLVIEVNGTPGFRGVNAASGRDMAEAVVAHAVARAEGGGRRAEQAR